MHVNVLNCKMQKKYKTVDCMKFVFVSFLFQLAPCNNIFCHQVFVFR